MVIFSFSTNLYKILENNLGGVIIKLPNLRRDYHAEKVTVALDQTERPSRQHQLQHGQQHRERKYQAGNWR
jgi:hypothetical protein